MIGGDKGDIGPEAGNFILMVRITANHPDFNGIDQVTHGEKKHSRALTIPLAKRLFYPAAQIFHAKNFELLLK